DIVQRLRACIVQVEHQPMPAIVAQGDDEGVVIGMVVAISHEQVEDLQVVVGLCPKDELPVDIYSVEEARQVVIYKIYRIAGGKTRGGANVGRCRRSCGCIDSATCPQAGELIFEPRLVIEDRIDGPIRQGWGNTSAQLLRHGVVRLGKNLTRGLVFEHVGRRIKVDAAGQIAAKATYIAKFQNHLTWQAALNCEIHHVSAAILEVGIVLKTQHFAEWNA